MPEALATGTSPTPENSAFVIDFASRVGYQRTITALADAGTFKDDEARGAAALAKRINRALYANFKQEGLPEELLAQITELQTRYRKLIEETPYDTLRTNGTITKLLDEYLDFLIARSENKLSRLKKGDLKSGDERNPTLLNSIMEEEEQTLVNLKGEKNTHANGTEYTTNLLKNLEPAVTAKNYLSLAKIVTNCDLVKGAEGQVAEDLVSDVLSILPARRLLQLSKRFGDGTSLEKLNSPDSTIPRESIPVIITAIAESVKQNTRSLSSLFEIENDTPELDRVVALEKLVSAQLHQAFSQQRELGDMITLEKKAQALLARYTQVSLSLSYDYLGIGPSKDDGRTIKLRENLKKEIEEAGIDILPLEEAKLAAQELATTSANDLLAHLENSNTPKITRIIQKGNIEKLAKMAGVDGQLTAQLYLIGKEINPDDPTIIVTRAALEGLDGRIKKERPSGVSI